MISIHFLQFRVLHEGNCTVFGLINIIAQVFEHPEALFMVFGRKVAMLIDDHFRYDFVEVYGFQNFIIEAFGIDKEQINLGNVVFFQQVF